MADFNPDKYLAEKAPGFNPDAYLREKGGAAAKPEEPGLGTAIARGAAQGATFGFGDEATGAIQAVGNSYFDAVDNLRAGDWKKALYNPGAWRKMLTDYRAARDSERSANSAAEKAHGGAYLASNIAGGLPAAIASGGAGAAGKVSAGAKLLQAVKQGAALGGTAGLGSSSADVTRGDIGGALGDTSLGAALGGAGGAIGSALGYVSGAAGKAANKGLASTEEGVARAAAAKAAAETASARSAAGTTAQDAYRQLEHLRELGRLGQLSPEQTQVAEQLSRELGDKATEKLLPAAERKAAAAAEYSDALETEGQRASAAAEEKLGGNEAGKQLMARVKRYGPAVAGGLAGHYLMPGFGGMGGAAAGLVLRPAIRSLVNLAKTPAVKSAMYRALGAAAEGATPALEGAAPGAMRLGTEIPAAVRVALSDEDKKKASVIAALRSMNP